MAQVTFRFLEPGSFFGNVITWRLRERFSHVAILIGDYAYSSTFPLVAMVPATHHSVSGEVRKCQDIVLEVTDEQLTGIQNWCETQLCKPYDFLSILGWIFGIHSWKSINTTYCFEFCRRPLTFLGLLPSSENQRLITGHQLYRELAALAGLAPDSSLVASVESHCQTGKKAKANEDIDWMAVAEGCYESRTQDPCIQYCSQKGLNAKPAVGL